MSASDWLSVASLAIVVVNLAGLLFLMRRLLWFRAVGWIGVVWMLHAILFICAVLYDHLILDFLQPIWINVWSSSLRLQAYFSLAAVLWFVGAEWWRGKSR